MGNARRSETDKTAREWSTASRQSSQGSAAPRGHFLQEAFVEREVCDESFPSVPPPSSAGNPYFGPDMV
jgi:hypothetical protein